MRFVLGCLVLCLGCTTDEKKPDPLTLHSGKIELPQVYPPVRDVTPAQLIADEQTAGGAPSDGLAGAAELGRARQKQMALNLASIVQDRFYSMGPTDILRIVKNLDDRVLGLDTDPASHACLTAAPVPWTYALPSGQSFSVKLQCLQELGAPGSAGAGWVAFGFDRAATRDAGPAVASDGNDFYIVEGQESGNGGAYHISGATGNVHGWLAVAERNVPLNSQVLLQLLTDEPAATLELSLGGAAVGFCGAHLKASADHLFVQGRINAAPPPGSPMAGQYCDTRRAACYATAALGTDLGESSSECAAVGPGAFAIRTELDASTDSGANVRPAEIWRYFSTKPTGVAAF